MLCVKSKSIESSPWPHGSLTVSALIIYGIQNWRVMVFLVWSFVWCSNWIAMTFFTANSGSNSPFLIRWMLLPMIRSLLNNMYEMENFLKQTDDINWTVVRPPGLKIYQPQVGSTISFLDIYHIYKYIHILYITIGSLLLLQCPLDHHTFSVFFLLFSKPTSSSLMKVIMSLMKMVCRSVRLCREEMWLVSCSLCSVTMLGWRKLLLLSPNEFVLNFIITFTSLAKSF